MTEQTTFRPSAETTSTPAISVDGELIALGLTNGVVEIWALNRNERQTMVQASDQSISHVLFSAAGDRLAIVDRNLNERNSEAHLRVWDLRQNRSLGAFDMSVAISGRGRASVAFSGEGDVLAAADQDYSVQIWDVETQQKRAVLKAHTWFVLDLAFAPHGGLLATASIDNTIRLWETRSWKEVGILRGHMGGVRSAAFSFDGRTLASCSADNVIKLWDVVGRQELVTLRQSPEDPSQILMSRDNGLMAASTLGGPGQQGDVLLLVAPSFDQIEAIERNKREWIPVDIP